jgi:pantoate--beta-alanine ligase
VNPLQFGPGEDFERYPRDLDNDARLAESRGVHLLYAPDAGEMFPAGETRVSVSAGPLEDRLCGAFRPGHFRGVLTIVAKLFHMVQPDVAVFGQKDLQQAVLIRRMVRDLDFPVDVRVAPIVREPDGLAMSSRNVYLSPDERAQAPAIHHALVAGRAAFARGESRAAGVMAVVRSELAHAPLIRIQYLALIDAETLDDVEQAEHGNALAIAVHLGQTRLIDNIVL